MECPSIIHWNSLEQSVSVFRDVGWYIFFFVSNFDRTFQNQPISGDPDQMPHNVASGLGLHCFGKSHKTDARLLWVNERFYPNTFSINS